MLKLSYCIVRLGTLSSVRRFSSSPVQVIDSINKGTTKENMPDHLGAGMQAGKHKSKGLVAAAFANLANDVDELLHKVQIPDKTESPNYFELRKEIEEKINNANDSQSLLSVVNTDILTRQQALKVISILSEWMNSGKINVTEFENDQRFIKLCRILGRQKLSSSKKVDMSLIAKNSEDLNTVIAIAGDDEAARLVANLNDKQMIKVMTTLALKKRRSPVLLRTLSYHLTKSTNAFDLKVCSDLLYAMATLNYPDMVLIDKIYNDIQERLHENKSKSSVLGSIVTSLGMLRCKDREMLDSITEWMVQHAEVTRPQDVAALTMSLAVLGYSSLYIDKLPMLKQQDFPKSSSYLDYIWSLVVLDLATNEHFSSVLKPEFIESLKINNDLAPSIAKKLININAYAILKSPSYRGPFLSENISEAASLSYSKEKANFVASLLDTLKSLLSSGVNLKTCCDSKMGFLYDAECLLDSKCNPYPVDSQSPKEKVLTKVAMLGLDYHDLCKPSNEPTGCIQLYSRLLQAQGYKVLLLPHTEYSTREKLLNRVQYIEKKLKEIVQH